MRPGETPREALLRFLRSSGPESGILLGFFTSNVGPLEVFIRGLKAGLRNFEDHLRDFEGRFDKSNPVSELVETLEAFVLEERASAFADGGEEMRTVGFPPVAFPPLRPLPPGLTLTHVSARPRFARTSEGVVLALDGISLIVPKKEDPGGYVYVGNTMHQLFSQDDMEALAGLLDAETAALCPAEAGEEGSNAAE